MRTQGQPGQVGHPAGRLRRRTWPIVASAIFVGLGLVYSYLWGPVVHHTPFVWTSPIDLWGTFNAAISFSHGHFGDAYAKNPGFLSLPGFLIVLAPLAALGSAGHETLLELGRGNHVLETGQVTSAHGVFLRTGTLASGGHVYVFHPQAWTLLAPYMLAVSCVALFASDALAERLGVIWTRRAILSVAQGVLLWNVTVLWGHPEDALAVALAIYAVIFVLDERWSGAGWLFGAAFAVQPLVIVVLPVLLFTKGRRGMIGLVVRSVAPAIVIALPSFVSDFHATFQALVKQPALPALNHRTPWTGLAPKLAGKGVNAPVGGGAVRSVTLVLAVLVGWWARRWKHKPEMLVWVMAVALALRSYTESVMTDYYVWPALAVGLVVAARASNWRFGAALVIALATTIVAQWNLGEWPWWILEIAGVTGLLAISARQDPLPVGDRPQELSSPPIPTAAHRRAPTQQQKKKALRTNRKAARR
jgi:hypothetical protein